MLATAPATTQRSARPAPQARQSSAPATERELLFVTASGVRVYGTRAAGQRAGLILKRTLEECAHPGA